MIKLTRLTPPGTPFSPPPCRAISHPNIVQAFACMTDVPVCELLRVCMAQAHGSMFKLPVYKYLQSMADKICHLEVRAGWGGVG